MEPQTESKSNPRPDPQSNGDDRMDSPAPNESETAGSEEVPGRGDELDTNLEEPSVDLEYDRRRDEEEDVVEEGFVSNREISEAAGESRELLIESERSDDSSGDLVDSNLEELNTDAVDGRIEISKSDADAIEERTEVSSSGEEVVDSHHEVLSTDAVEKVTNGGSTSRDLKEEVIKEASSSGDIKRENSEIEFDSESAASSSGYVGERGSSCPSVASETDEAEDGGVCNGVVPRNDSSSNGVYDSASWVPGKRHGDEDDASISWRKRKKHFFVLSHSGKPIYSRYGNEHKLAGFSATLQAIVSFVENGGDHVNFVRAGNHQVIFLVKGPIYLVCISCTEEPHEALREQLELIYGQLLLILTKSIDKCFEKNQKFDMTPLLGGTDVVFSSLIHSFSWNPATFLHAYTCLPLAYPTRQAAGAILQDVADSGVLFAILMCKHKVISLFGAQKASLHPDDMLLLANFVLSSESFRTSESFTPICLPRYNPMGFLYAYVHYLDADTYLILLTTSSDAFFHLKDCRKQIEAVLLKSNVLNEIQRSLLEGGLHVEDLPTDPSPHSGYVSLHLGHDRPEAESPTVARERNTGIGGPTGLWHFIYRSINLDQYVSSEFSSPISSCKQQKRLFRAYEKLYSSMHDKATGPSKTQIRRDDNYVMLCWVTQDFELYAAFDPLADKALAIKTCNQVCQWVRDIENEVFLLGASPFSW